MNQIEWDIQTVTLSDYAVEFPIKKNNFESWKSDAYYKEGLYKTGVPIGVALQRHLTVEIERMLTEDLHDKAKELTDNLDDRMRRIVRVNHLEKVKIADINFAYNNAALISKLRERGT